MTIKDVLDQRILRVRQKVWADPKDYLTFDYVEGGIGPWAHLFARRTQEAIKERTPQDVLIMRINKATDFEVYTGPADPADTRTR